MSLCQIQVLGIYFALSSLQIFEQCFLATAGWCQTCSILSSSFRATCHSFVHQIPAQTEIECWASKIVEDRLSNSLVFITSQVPLNKEKIMFLLTKESLVKISKSRKQIMVSLILPNNEPNTLRIIVSFLRFYGKIRDFIFCFRDLQTFSHSGWVWCNINGIKNVKLGTTLPEFSYFYFNTLNAKT